MKRLVKSLAIVLTLAVVIIGLSPITAKASPTYRFGGEYTRRDKEQETTFKLIMQEYSSPEGKTVGYIDMVHREFYAEYMGHLKAGINHWSLKKVGKNKYKSKKLNITVYKKKVVISGKYAEEYGFKGTYKLKKRYIS